MDETDGVDTVISTDMSPCVCERWTQIQYHCTAPRCPAPCRSAATVREAEEEKLTAPSGGRGAGRRSQLPGNEDQKERRAQELPQPTAEEGVGAPRTTPRLGSAQPITAQSPSRLYWPLHISPSVFHMGLRTCLASFSCAGTHIPCLHMELHPDRL
ncbi:hypothetical protein AGOR_G00005010 [Albula goreensis]|uniref:Uncharacterized protein n=1 Tax=Albula goreensis TaxID=1534307 RepID=A0A8T3E884_9TELE|nr:hypothetical protein AGOR_G00005010 [Albula goreensis]